MYQQSLLLVGPNFKGLKFVSKFTTIGTITGILIPGALLIVSAIIYLTTGNPAEVTFSMSSVMPDLSSIANIAFLSGLFLFFAGMEVSAVHAGEVKNPKKDFPRAILISAIIIVVIFLLGALAIAVVVPQGDISLVAGIMEAFMTIFEKFNMVWVIPLIALLAAPGMIAQISTWIAGPSKALLVTAENGNLPPFFQKVNKEGVPTNILFVQGCIVTVISMVFLFMPTVSSSFWILTALTAMLYLLMYIILFSAAIKLRYSRPNVERAYKIPGGKFGMWFVAGIGIVACVFAIFIGFFPPSQVATGNIFFFEGFLVIGLVIMCGVPLLIYRLKKPSWKSKKNLE